MAAKVTTDGCTLILDYAVAAWNAAANLQIALFKSAHTPVPGDNTASYSAIESSFPGYARVTVPSWNSPAPDGLGGAFTMAFSLANFTATGASGEFVYGYFVFDPTSGLVIGGEEFPAPGPYDMTTTGSQLNVQARLFEDPV